MLQTSTWAVAQIFSNRLNDQNSWPLMVIYSNSNNYNIMIEWIVVVSFSLKNVPSLGRGGGGDEPHTHTGGNHCLLCELHTVTEVYLKTTFLSKILLFLIKHANWNLKVKTYFVSDDILAAIERLRNIVTLKLFPYMPHSYVVFVWMSMVGGVVWLNFFPSF